ncbi:MAG: phosphoadenylyl-sulfate reductase [Verrucomicrobiales bacterium]
MKTSQYLQNPDPDAAALSAELAELKAGERISLLYERWGSRVVASTSFGLQAAVMLKLIADHAPNMPIVFIDTGYLFPGTYQYAERLTEKYDLDIRVYNPRMTPARQEALYGQLWEQGAPGLEKYGLLNKVEPMNRALQELDADIWLSGVRRVQSKTRAERDFAEQQSRTLKVYPILDWVDAKIASFFYENELERHPLEDKGYRTMGDWHSTRPVGADGDVESTRYGGEKYECGLHEVSGSQDFQI